MRKAGRHARETREGTLKILSNNKLTNMSETKESGWIGVDLDGTLAHYDGWKGVDHIGAPIAPMVERVRLWLKQGKAVKIFTARMHGHGVPIFLEGGSTKIADVVTPIEQWCEKYLGQKLPVTNVKDFGMTELWDDRAVQVVSNTGLTIEDLAKSNRAARIERVWRLG